MVLVLVLVVGLFAAPARAADDCGAALRQSVTGVWTIVKSMADYKAAMDAGYAACMVNYPAEFAPLREVNDFMQTNMQRELEQAQAVLDHLIDEPASKAAVKSCEGDEKARALFREDAHALIKGQYSKAYARRHRAMAKADLASRDQDSCLIVLDMVKKYQQYYGDYKQLRHVLYESMKKQQKESDAVSRSDFKIFEKTRDGLFAE